MQNIIFEPEFTARTIDNIVDYFPRFVYKKQKKSIYLFSFRLVLDHGGSSSREVGEHVNSMSLCDTVTFKGEPIMENCGPWVANKEQQHSANFLP